MRRLDKLMQEDAAWKRLNILTDKLREIKNLDELPSLKYPDVKYIESPVPVEGYAQKKLLRNKLLWSIDNISPFFIPEDMKVRLYGELDDIIKAVHEYDKSIGADHIGVALKREEGESASSYLSRCLYPEYRKIFYESNNAIKKKEFEKIRGDQDKYINRYVEDEIRERIAYLEKQKEKKLAESAALQKAFISSKTDYTLKEKCDASDYADTILPTSVTYGENDEEYKLHKIIEAAFIAGHKKEQKPAEWSEEDERMLSRCIKSVECSKRFANSETYKAAKDVEMNWLKALPERFNIQPKQEWSEEDEKMIEHLIRHTQKEFDELCNDRYGHQEIISDLKESCRERMNWLENRLKSLRPQPKEEREPIEIKYAGKIYKVYGTKELPGGVVGYIIEDEPGHYDCIIHPDEMLGGGYGIKSNGSPYPTKEANFGQPHWKPSDRQIGALLTAYRDEKASGSDVAADLINLYHDLKKQM